MIPFPAVQILIAVLIASALMTGLWFIQRRTHNAGIVDAGWAAAIGLLASISTVRERTNALAATHPEGMAVTYPAILSVSNIEY